MQAWPSHKESHTFTYPMILLQMEKAYVWLCYTFNSRNLPPTLLTILFSKIKTSFILLDVGQIIKSKSR